MKTIPLTQGFEAIVDDDDYEWLSQWKWFHFRGYAVRNAWAGKYKQSRVSMHRVVSGAMPGFETDHINGDSLDNRKGNLRTCTMEQNKRNRRTGKNNTSGYKGVQWCKRSKKWKAGIMVNRKAIHIGLYQTKEAAAKMYNEAAIKHHGQFAKLNTL